MKAIDHRRGVRAVRFDGTDIRLAHVATPGLDLIPLEVTELRVKEFIDALPTFTEAYSDDFGQIQIVDQSGVFMAFIA